MHIFLRCIIVVLLCFGCEQKAKEAAVLDASAKNLKLGGSVFGTTYTILYSSERDYKVQFDSIFTAINQSLSTYLPSSDISKLNRNEQTSVDAHFERVFRASKHIFEVTDGVFDPTIGNVVNAWQFGADHQKFTTDSTTITNLMRYVGLDKVVLRDKMIQKPSKTYLEFNAIAKGYGVDAIGEFLESKGISNYLVEIGGEIRVKGQNLEKQKPWRVGLDEPRFDGEQSIYKVLTLKDEAMATSGTYRKFKIDAQGNRYAHIIDTATGYPAKSNILSVSVITSSCMIADAYATAFQAMGVDKLKSFLKTHQELKVFIIFENNNGVLETLALNGFPEN